MTELNEMQAGSISEFLTLTKRGSMQQHKWMGSLND